MTSPSIAPADLAELMASFNDVTSKLEQTHDKLRGEVSRLTRELKQANEALERSRRLAALGQMAAGIAHEIRNPLGSIALYARMLDEDLGSMPEQRETAVKIGSAVRRLDEIVTDVLSFSRELRIRPAPSEPAALFAAAIEACCVQEELVERADESVPLELACDTHLIHQALTNIIRNAIDAMREGDATPRLKTIAREGSDGGVILAVEDNGPGIPPDVIDRMFNPFFTTRSAGTGLGLAIVHRIAEAHGGSVVVRNNADSVPGARGATIELHLPAVAAAQTPIIETRPIQPGALPNTHAPSTHPETAASTAAA